MCLSLDQDQVGPGQGSASPVAKNMDDAGRALTRHSSGEIKAPIWQECLSPWASTRLTLFRPRSSFARCSYYFWHLACQNPGWGPPPRLALSANRSNVVAGCRSPERSLYCVGDRVSHPLHGAHCRSTHGQPVKRSPPVGSLARTSLTGRVRGLLHRKPEVKLQ